MTTTKKAPTKAAAKTTSKAAATTKAVVPDNAIKLTKKDAELLEALSEELQLKPETVIHKALAALEGIEEARKKFGFGAGKLRAST